MQKSKLIRLLKVLEADEFKNYAKFIQSPFFNGYKHYLPFYKFLSKYYPNFDSPKLTKELAFKKCFPDKVYNYNKISNLMSGFFTLTEQYLLNIQFQKKQFTKKKILVEAFSERKDCYDLYEKYNTTLVQEVERRAISDMAYHQDLRELNHNFFYHPTTNRQTIGNNSIQQLSDNLDIFYAQTKLLYLLEMKSRAYIFGEEYTLIWDEKGMFEKETYFKKESPICLIYLKVLKLYELIEDKAIFEEAKKLFSEQIGEIGKMEKTIILLHLLNYCIRAVNKGSLLYIKESLELYKIGLLYYLFIERNRMAEITFSNIVATGAALKEFEWTRIFIDSHNDFLEESEKKDAQIYSIAILDFHEQKYLKVIEGLNSHSFEKPIKILKSKSLLIRAFFELFLRDISYYEMLLAQTYAFEKYIRRNSIISIEKSEPYLHLIQFVRHLTNHYIEKKIPENLIKSLESKVSISSKGWLLKIIKHHFLNYKKERILID